MWSVAHDKAQKRQFIRKDNGKKPPEVTMLVCDLLTSYDCSPEQISGYLLKEQGIAVSKNYIYNLIYDDATGELAKHCRHGASRCIGQNAG